MSKVYEYQIVLRHTINVETVVTVVATNTTAKAKALAKFKADYVEPTLKRGSELEIYVDEPEFDDYEIVEVNEITEVTTNG